MPVTISANAYPTRATCWHDESTVLTGGAITPTYDLLQDYAIYVFQAGAANADSFTQSVFLRAGTYTLSVFGETGPTLGKQDWYVDGVLAASAMDWYTAGIVNNVKKTASITIATDGYHVIKSIVNGKNASSTNFFIWLTVFWLSQAAD